MLVVVCRRFEMNLAKSARSGADEPPADGTVAPTAVRPTPINKLVTSPLLAASLDTSFSRPRGSAPVRPPRASRYPPSLHRAPPRAPTPPSVSTSRRKAKLGPHGTLHAPRGARTPCNGTSRLCGTLPRRRVRRLCEPEPDCTHGARFSPPCEASTWRDRARAALGSREPGTTPPTSLSTTR